MKNFYRKIGTAYILNQRTDLIEMVLVVTKGYDVELKTSTMRHAIKEILPNSYAKIELMQEDVLELNNEFYVTFFAEGKLFEKKFVFRKNTINDRALQDIPFMVLEGVNEIVLNKIKYTKLFISNLQSKQNHLFARE